MTAKKNPSEKNNWSPTDILDVKHITNSREARILLHRDKKKILTLLIEKESTIQEISKSTGINPGTIKRHLDGLIENRFVFLSNQKRSEYNVKMKFYSAVAREFIIDIHIPENKEEK